MPQLIDKPTWHLSQPITDTLFLFFNLGYVEDKERLAPGRGHGRSEMNVSADSEQKAQSRHSSLLTNVIQSEYAYYEISILEYNLLLSSQF